MDWDFSEIENEIEQQEENIEQIEQKQEQIEARDSILKESIQKIAEDTEIIVHLAENVQENEREVQENKQRIEQEQLRIYDVQEGLEQQLGEINEERSVLEMLKSIGEDVSEAEEILNERENILQEANSRLQELADRLGISLAALEQEIVAPVKQAMENVEKKQPVEEKMDDHEVRMNAESNNDSVTGEVSDELNNALEPFEQSNWDNMSPQQQKEAVLALRDSIADDLGLQEKPEIKYYNNNDDTDFGGYSPSENTIYINEHNMGDAKETADSIAHESRHCWQHEMADNSDSPQAQAFKENFDDYIRPEDDYRGYRNQPVEADAREYAKNITDNISNQKTVGDENVDVTPSDANATSNDIRQNKEEKGTVFDSKSEIPTDLESKSGEFEPKIKEPDEYASKFEYDTQQKLENYYKEDDGKLSDSQKQDLVSDLKKLYDNVDKGNRGDVLVPENSKDVTSVYYNEKTGKYDVGYDWKPVDTVPETRTMEVMKAGQQFDRVGSPSGRCTSAVNEDGSCATVKERSIPYHFTEDDITKEPSYHRYQAEQDFTKENLSNAIDNSMYSDDKKAEMHTNLDRYYENAQVKGYGDGDGLAAGEIAPMFEDTTGATGGGKQYDMPLSMEELENIGMISEVGKGTC